MRFMQEGVLGGSWEVMSGVVSRTTGVVAALLGVGSHAAD